MKNTAICEFAYNACVQIMHTNRNVPALLILFPEECSDALIVLSSHLSGDSVAHASSPWPIASGNRDNVGEAVDAVVDSTCSCRDGVLKLLLLAVASTVYILVSPEVPPVHVSCVHARQRREQTHIRPKLNTHSPKVSAHVACTFFHPKLSSYNVQLT